jgi:sec-independent protein translocase protein TatB
MIDLGLSKLALIGVVALIVIGPEKLPKVARMAGSLYGRMQRYINQVKSEVSREIELDELRKMQTEVQDAARDIGNSIGESLAEVQNDLNSAWSDNANEMMPLSAPVSDAQLARKAKDFRRKKLSRTAAIPVWYKQRNGGKTHVISAAARVAKYRPASKSAHSFF